VSISHFNYTGRRRIDRSHVTVAVEGTPPNAKIGASFDLDQYALPGTANVVLEAQAGWTVQRFEWGSVAQLSPPVNVTLDEFASLAGLLFRLKIVASGEAEGRILGEADRLRPSGTIDEASQRSFIVVRPEDLGQVPWRVGFDDDQPLLLVNKRLGDYHELLQRKEVAALVLPAVLRQVLLQAGSTGDEIEDRGSWQSQAIRFAEKLGGVEIPDSEDEEALERWAAAAVDAFARRHRFVDGLVSWLEVEE
jgi:hypothetical protein